MRRNIATLFMFCLFLLIQPGFNVVQQYQIHSGEQTILPAPIDIPTTVTLPIRKAYTQTPTLTASSAIVIDKESSAFLYAKNPDQQLFPASVTKIMTALVALDTYDLDKSTTITREHDAIGSSMKLEQGEVITVKNLLKGLLIASGNDAAYALAESYPGGYGEFIKAMNAKAKALHMDNTNFTNVSGVEQDEHITTVRDIAVLTKVAMENTFFRETVGTKELIVTDVSGTITHHVVNTNILLGTMEGVIGVKTGWTDLAGECLVTETIKDGRDIITVVLNSKDRFGESKQLIQWAFARHDWTTFTAVEPQ